MVQTDSLIELLIEKPVAGGRMLARHDGQIVLVSGAIPGERVRARVERTTRGVAFAETREALAPADTRRDALVDPACGGMLYAHIRYDAQVDIKRDVLRDALARGGRIDWTGDLPVAASPEQAYRLRARLHVRRGRAGFFREGTHALCDAAPTLQLRADAMAAIEAFVAATPREWLDAIDAIELTENLPADERALHLQWVGDGRPPKGDPPRAWDLAALPGITGISCDNGSAAGGHAAGTSRPDRVDRGRERDHGRGRARGTGSDRDRSFDRDHGRGRGPDDSGGRGRGGSHGGFAAASHAASRTGSRVVAAASGGRGQGGRAIAGGGAGMRVRTIAGTPFVSDPLSALLAAAPGTPASPLAARLQRHAASFFQANRFLLPQLVSAVLRQVGDGPVIDCYAGVGLFAVSLVAAGHDGGVLAIEGDAGSSRDLAINAQPFAAHLRVAQDAVERVLAREPMDPDATVIVDPPRTGLSREALDLLLRARPARIVYVSCDVATLARDLRRARDEGYDLTHVEAFDLFPGTAHIESLAVLRRA